MKKLNDTLFLIGALILLPPLVALAAWITVVLELVQAYRMGMLRGGE